MRYNADVTFKPSRACRVSFSLFLARKVVFGSSEMYRWRAQFTVPCVANSAMRQSEQDGAHLFHSDRTVTQPAPCTCRVARKVSRYRISIESYNNVRFFIKFEWKGSTGMLQVFINYCL